MDRQILIAKIEKLQENIKNQVKISPLDIDLQLSYIRDLYDAYLEVKYNFTYPYHLDEEQTEEPNSSQVPDNETFPLFEEEGKEGEIGEIGEIGEEEEIGEMEEEEEIDELGEDEDEEFEEEEEIEEIEEEEEDYVDEEEIDIEEEEEIEVETPVVMDRIEISIPDAAEVEETEEPISDINLDDIEFAEDSSDDEDLVVKNQPTTFTAGMPPTRYYDDGIEIDKPIPVKPVTIGEQFKSEKPSLNEIVSSYKPDESLAAKLQQANVSDLMKSIDMSQKFLFVKELFNNNGNVFTEEINKLNGFNKLNEAIPYLESIKAKYKWEQNEAYSELYRLVLRKFAIK